MKKLNEMDLNVVSGGNLFLMPLIIVALPDLKPQPKPSDEPVPTANPAAE